MYENCDKHEPSTRTKYGYDEFNRLSTRIITAGTVLNYSYTYDRWGNRTAQTITAGGSGPQPSVSVNTSTNHISSSGFGFDAAGNMTNDTSHSYTFDADGNITAVDGGSTAAYVYNALNQRVRSIVGGTTTEYVFNVNGQRVSEWNGSGHAQLKGKYYWGGKPVAYYVPSSAVHFEHQDWLGTERKRTSYNGSVEGTFSSLPFGDGQSATGTDTDANHFAALDHDTESNTDHAQFRQYSNVQGRWLAPDPYAGSYDFSNPQSLNRYVYASNRPLSLVDVQGLEDDPCGDGGGLKSAGAPSQVSSMGDGIPCMDPPGGPPEGPIPPAPPTSCSDPAVSSCTTGTPPPDPTPDPPVIPPGPRPTPPGGAGTAPGNPAPNNPSQPQQPQKKPCNGWNRLAGVLKAADGYVTTSAMVDLAGIHYALGGVIAGATCLTPEPAEPVACAAGIFSGGSLWAGGTALGYGAYVVAKEEMIPGIKQAITCEP